MTRGSTRALAVASLLLLAAPGGLAGHPCEQEVSSACPDRPAAELAACLKNPEDHETQTTLSSECTDFVALNAACAEDITKHCDEAFFSEDTVLCLKTWTDPENISPKCAEVMRWAIPKEEGDGPTDELGLSDEDYAERDKEKSGVRSERHEEIMKMKAEDAKKEKERQELETFKREHPEEYAQMVEQREEEERQQAAFKKRERMIAAALERKKRQEAGIKDEDEDEEEKKKEKAKAQEPPPKRSRRPSNGGGEKVERASWFQALLCMGFVAAVLGGGYVLIVRLVASESKKGGKKKRKSR